MNFVSKGFLIAAALVALTGSRPIDAANRASQPNILVIVADDMGFADAGCYGGEIQTPNLDKLAAGGLRFTQFYNTARCWPSRACILTGYYAQQVNRDELPGGGGGMKGRRPAWARLLPELLRPLGYRSYHSGKWHVDGTAQEGGFDVDYDYTDTDYHFIPAGKKHAGEYASAAEADEAMGQLDGHAAHYAGRPFFQYLCFTEPHFPLQAPQADIDLYRTRYLAGWDVLRQERLKRMTDMGIVNCGLGRLDTDIWPAWNMSKKDLAQRIGPGEVGRAVPWETLTAEQKQFQPIKMAIHAAMIHRVDAEIGRVVEHLKAIGVFENTAIFFVSDNGASAEQIIRGGGHDKTAPPGSAKTFLCLGPPWASAANTPLRLHKSYVHEGGISTPLIVHWPRGISARGELRHDPGHLIDLAPTVLELAGGRWPATYNGKAVPPPPGKSLVPALAKDGSVTHDYLWWYHSTNRAIRVGNWKLVAVGKSPWELYDLSSDRCEAHDLAAEHPEKVKQLAQAWNAHAEEFRALVKDASPPPATNTATKKP